MNMYICDLNKLEDVEEFTSLGGKDCTNKIGRLSNKPIWQFTENKIVPITSEYDVFYDPYNEDDGDGVYASDVMRLSKVNDNSVQIIIHNGSILNVSSLNTSDPFIFEILSGVIEPVITYALNKDITFTRAMLQTPEWVQTGVNLMVIDNTPLSKYEIQLSEYFMQEILNNHIDIDKQIVEDMIKGFRNYNILYTP